MRTRNYSGISLLLAAFFIFAAPAAARADSLFRLFPEGQLNGYYGDNIPFRTTNEVGDFGSIMVGGFYLDYTSAARYASLHYDTFVQLFAHESRYDRAGEGQCVSATDDENLSPTTKLRLNEFFYRDEPGYTDATVSGEAPQFNIILAQLLLANDEASVNRFNADLSHDWGSHWSSRLGVSQSTLWANSGTNSNTSYLETIDGVTYYHFSNRFVLGAGYRYYDFRFSLPGQPGVQAQWPFGRVSWQLAENLYFEGMVGVVISHTQGTSGQEVNPGGSGTLDYTLQRARLKIAGGQEPELLPVFGTFVNVRYVNGVILYDFTPRLTGNAGGSYYDFSGSGSHAEFASWGVGLSDRVNKWLSVYARFIQLRRVESGANQFLPSGSQNLRGAVSDYFVVGFSASVEAFRWSWQ